MSTAGPWSASPVREPRDMRIRSVDGALTVELSRFGVRDAERLHEILEALAPVPVLVLDFRHVAEFEVAAVLSLAGVLDDLEVGRVEFRAVTMRQARLLEYVRAELGGKGTGEGR